MRVLLVEDDPEYSSAVKEHLESLFVGTTLEVIDSEAAFQECFAGILTNPPDLIILDIMIRWTTPGRSPFYSSPFADGREFTRAGTRCLTRLAESPRAASIPVIIHSVLDRADFSNSLQTLPSHYSILNKHSSLDALVRHISAVYPGLAMQDNVPLLKRVWRAFGATVRFFGFSLDLKRLFSRKNDRHDRGA